MAGVVEFLNSRGPALTISEVAQALGCSRKHVYAMIRRGRLPVIHIGYRMRVDRAAIMRWLDGQI